MFTLHKDEIVWIAFVGKISIALGLLDLLPRHCSTVLGCSDHAMSSASRRTLSSVHTLSLMFQESLLDLQIALNDRLAHQLQVLVDDIDSI